MNHFQYFGVYVKCYEENKENKLENSLVQLKDNDENGDEVVLLGKFVAQSQATRVLCTWESLLLAASLGCLPHFPLKKENNTAQQLQQEASVLHTE